jgi:hypothetical protein
MDDGRWTTGTTDDTDGTDDVAERPTAGVDDDGRWTIEDGRLGNHR